jgi:hypothetical protein
MSTMQNCQTHTDRAGEFTCDYCKGGTCGECLRTRADGTVVCARCEARAAAAAAARAADDTYALADGAPARPPRSALANVPKCVDHPEVDAVARCLSCRKLMCGTCMFEFPGDVRLCPACATDPKQALSPQRKTQSMWSMGLGIGGAVGTILMFVVATSMAGNLRRDTVEMMGCLVILIGIASLIGLVLGITAFRRGTYNPGYLWVGPILNGLMVAYWGFHFVSRMA